MEIVGQLTGCVVHDSNSILTVIRSSPLALRGDADGVLAPQVHLLLARSCRQAELAKMIRAALGVWGKPDFSSQVKKLTTKAASAATYCCGRCTCVIDTLCDAAALRIRTGFSR